MLGANWGQNSGVAKILAIIIYRPLINKVCIIFSLERKVRKQHTGRYLSQQNVPCFVLQQFHCAFDCGIGFRFFQEYLVRFLQLFELLIIPDSKLPQRLGAEMQIVRIEGQTFRRCKAIHFTLVCHCPQCIIDSPVILSQIVIFFPVCQIISQSTQENRHILQTKSFPKGFQNNCTLFLIPNR